MGTRSTIALEYADGTVDQVYCHFDGYLEHNGMMLMKHYQDPFKVQQMMDLGDMSSLHAEIGEKHPFSPLGSGFTCEEYDAKFGKMCTFYGRDRDEVGVEAKRFSDFDAYRLSHQYEEYEYILRTDGNWYVCRDESKVYKLLSEML
jgi:hypothetical protein